MTLDEAIKHCEEVADAGEKYCDTHYDEEYATDNYRLSNKCASEHRQLAEWLKELKERRESDRQKILDKMLGWISIKDREPQDEGDYLVCFDDGFIATTSYVDNDWELWADAGEVVAWMPLPEPYEEVSEDENGD